MSSGGSRAATASSGEVYEGSPRAVHRRSGGRRGILVDLEPGHGYNAVTGEYENLVSAGIIDPVKVTRSALQNAASIAALVLTTETLVAEKKNEDDDQHQH